MGSACATLVGAIVIIEDRSCGQCGSCLGGWTLWCEAPLPEGIELVADHAQASECAGAPTRLLTSLLLADSCRAALSLGDLPGDAVVAIVQPDEADRAVTAALIRLIHTGPILSGPHTGDPTLREQVGREAASGRARIVATSGSARDAAKAAERGGIVCVAGRMSDPPTVTEFVQRELCIVSPRNLRALVGAAGGAVAVQSAIREANRAAAAPDGQASIA